MAKEQAFPDVHSFMKSILSSEDVDHEDVASVSPESTEILGYLEQLLQSDTQQLLSEDGRLEEISKDLHANKAALVLENYAVLLEASTQLEEISRDLPDMKRQLQMVLAHYATTEEQAKSFWSRASEFGNQRSRSQQQIGQLTLIQDLLEIPCLIDNLAKHALFDEVVDLVYFVEKLVSAVPDGKVIQMVAEETRARTWVVMNLLSHQLGTLPVQLLQVLKIVSLERRLGQVMAINVEEHVRTDFLQARSIFTSSLVRAVSQKDTYQFLTKVTEICRLHFFETMNYYLSVFPDSVELPSDLRTLPYVWLEEELTELCSLIEKSLSLLSDNRLEPSFNQCMHFSEALSRFGSNMSMKFLRVFLQHLMEGLNSQLEAAMVNFRTGIREICVIKKNRASARPVRTDDQIQAQSEALADFPVLLDLYNAIVTALTRPRSCFISSLTVPVMLALNKVLKETTTLVEEGSVNRTLSPECEHSYTVVLLPAVEKLRDSLSSHQEAARLLGVSLQQVGLLLTLIRNMPDSGMVDGDAGIANGHESV